MATVSFDPEAIGKMMDDALLFCAHKSGFNGKEHALNALRHGDCCVCDYLRYALAKELAGYLGRMDETVRAVYTYEPEYACGPEQSLLNGAHGSRGLNLVAHVSRKSAALASLVDAVDRALESQRQKIGCPNANALCMDLDVKFVDDDEVGRRLGYGALVGSLYVAPVELWHR